MVRWSALSPDGTHVALLNIKSGKLQFKETRSGKITYFTPPNHPYSIEGFTPDSKQLVYGVQVWSGGGIYILNPTSTTSPRPLGVGCLAFSPDGQIAVGADNSSITLWNPKTWATLRNFPALQQDTVWNVAVSHNGQLIAISTSNGARVFDGASGWEVAQFRCDPALARISLSPDGSQLALSGENEVQIWEIGSRDRLMVRALYRRLTGRR